MYQAGEVRGEQPKASVLKGLQVNVDLVLSPLPDLKSQEGWRLVVLSTFSVSELNTGDSHADSIFAEGLTKLMHAFHSPLPSIPGGRYQSAVSGWIFFGGVLASIHACTQGSRAPRGVCRLSPFAEVCDLGNCGLRMD